MLSFLALDEVGQGSCTVRLSGPGVRSVYRMLSCDMLGSC